MDGRYKDWDSFCRPQDASVRGGGHVIMSVCKWERDFVLDKRGERRMDKGKKTKELRNKTKAKTCLEKRAARPAAVLPYAL